MIGTNKFLTASHLENWKDNSEDEKADKANWHGVEYAGTLRTTGADYCLRLPTTWHAWPPAFLKSRTIPTRPATTAAACLCVSRPITAEITAASKPRRLPAIYWVATICMSWQTSMLDTWLELVGKSTALGQSAWIHQLLTCDPIWPGDELIGNCPPGKFSGHTVNLLSHSVRQPHTKMWIQAFS